MTDDNTNPDTPDTPDKAQESPEDKAKRKAARKAAKKAEAKRQAEADKKSSDDASARRQTEQREREDKAHDAAVANTPEAFDGDVAAYNNRPSDTDVDNRGNEYPVATFRSATHHNAA